MLETKHFAYKMDRTSFFNTRGQRTRLISNDRCDLVHHADMTSHAFELFETRACLLLLWLGSKPPVSLPSLVALASLSVSETFSSILILA